MLQHYYPSGTETWSEAILESYLSDAPDEKETAEETGEADLETFEE